MYEITIRNRETNAREKILVEADREADAYFKAKAIMANQKKDDISNWYIQKTRKVEES